MVSALRPAATAVTLAAASRVGAFGSRPRFPAALPRVAPRPARCRRPVSVFATATAARDVTVSPGANHADLPKNFEHGATEERLYAWWEDNGCFKPDMDATGEPFTIAMPPPNVTGALHM